ncbi:hypothetical protein [Staphylococcus epidermidis]
MYKDYNMTQLTLPMETSVLIPTNDISRHVNDIVETILETEFRHHRDAISYHPKMMLKVVYMPIPNLCFQDVDRKNT